MARGDAAGPTKAPRTRARKLGSEVRRAQLAEAALQIVGSRGLRALSVGEVARCVGIVPSGVYKHFADKDELIDAALGLVGDRLLSNVGAACRESEDPVDCLHRLLTRHAALVQLSPGIPRLVFSDDVYVGHPERKARIYGFVTRYLGAVADLVRKGQKAGRLRRDLDPATVSVLFLGLIQPAGILWHLSEGAFDAATQLERGWEVLASALAAPKGRRRASRPRGQEG